MIPCEDCGGTVSSLTEHEPWCMGYNPPTRPARKKPAPGPRCFICRQRIQDCECPDGTDPD